MKDPNWIEKEPPTQHHGVGRAYTVPEHYCLLPYGRELEIEVE